MAIFLQISLRAVFFVSVLAHTFCYGILDEAVRLRRRMLDDMVPEPDDLEAVEDLDDVGGDVMNGVKSYLSHRRRRL